MKRAIYLIVLLVLIVGAANAQYSSNRSIFGMTWDFGLPLDNTKDYIDRTSFLGFNLNGRTPISPEISVGGMFGWNVFDLVSRDPIEIERPGFGGTISGTQERYLNMFPMMASGFYNFDTGDIVPYAGLNLGAYYVIQRFAIGTIALEQYTWHFGVAPEVGILVSLGGSTYLMASAQYHYAFDSGETIGGKDDNSYSWIGLNLGLAFTSF